MRGWWIAGVGSIASAWILCFAAQVVSADPLPPRISVSQYGVGPHGWIFSLWMLTVSLGICLLYLYRPVRGLGAGWWLLVCLIGSAVMAIVRTDPGGLQESLHAKIHTGASVLALGGLPIGCMLALFTADRVWRWTAITLVTISALALELLLVSAGGYDTTGAGPAASWAFWQAVALVADMILPVVQIFGVLTIAPLRHEPEPWWQERAMAGAVAARRSSRVRAGQGPAVRAAGS